MQPWLKVSLLLCVFGFFRELRPSEPFVTEFLSGEWRDIEPEQLNRDVYPIGTYSHLGLLVFMFLLTDVLRYDHHHHHLSDRCRSRHRNKKKPRYPLPNTTTRLHTTFSNSRAEQSSAYKS
uniref:Putative reduced folate carrier n=1 Tax=Anopheles triannulatus TaxID=58253 RepID=A0A2M4B371_9DIPT